MKHMRIPNVPDYASLALTKCFITKKCGIECCHYTVEETPYKYLTCWSKNLLGNWTLTTTISSMNQQVNHTNHTKSQHNNTKKTPFKLTKQTKLKVNNRYWRTRTKTIWGFNYSEHWADLRFLKPDWLLKLVGVKKVEVKSLHLCRVQFLYYHSSAILEERSLESTLAVCVPLEGSREFVYKAAL